MNDALPKRKSRRGRKAKVEALDTADHQQPVWPGLPGGRYHPINEEDLPRIHETILTLMDKTGFSEATPAMIDQVTAAGGTLTNDARLTFPPDLVEKALKGLRRRFTICGQISAHDMNLSGANVHMGSGGASPHYC